MKLKQLGESTKQKLGDVTSKKGRTRGIPMRTLYPNGSMGRAFHDQQESKEWDWGIPRPSSAIVILSTLTIN